MPDFGMKKMGQSQIIVKNGQNRECKQLSTFADFGGFLTVFG
jgi:hypothetical protein